MSHLDHKHLIVNAVIRKPPKEGDEPFMVEWLDAVVKAVGMKVVIGPHAHYCKADGNNGITASVNIETSHASLHVWDKTDPAIFRFDLYSCATFDVDTVLDYIEGFQPVELHWVLLDRNEKIGMKLEGYRKVHD